MKGFSAGFWIGLAAGVTLAYVVACIAAAIWR